MKKTIALVCLLLAIALNASAEGYGVFMEISMRNGSYYGKVNRAPKRIALDVVFDPETRCVTVTGDGSMEAEVFLYNASEQMEDYSSSINTNLFITSHGCHKILVIGEDWTAEGFVEI